MAKKAGLTAQQLNTQDRIRYDKLLQETREKSKKWRISVDNINVIEFTFLNDDANKIRLVHYKRKDSYHFYNFPGTYTYDDYRRLEKAIFKALHLNVPLYVNQKGIQESVPEVKKIRKDIVLDELEAGTRSGKYKWTESKDPKLNGLFSTVYDGSWTFFKVSRLSGSNSFKYSLKIVDSKEEWILQQREGELFANLVKEPFKQVVADKASVESNEKRNSLNPSTEQALSVKKRDEALRKEKQKRDALENELNSVLLTQYVGEDGIKCFGIEFLTLKSSMNELERIRGAVLPDSVNEFSLNMSEFLSKINRYKDSTPESVELYKELIGDYVKQYRHGKSQLSSGDISKYTRLLQALQEKQDEIPHAVTRAAQKKAQKTEEPSSNTKRVQKVGTRDFVIRSSVLSCMYKQHSIVNIDASIKIVTRSGVITERIVPAGYCQQCQKFFILEDDFKSLSDFAEPLCNVIDEKRYRANYNRKDFFESMSEWPEQSILRKCGYTVDQKVNLSTDERRRILANVIDHDVFSKIEISSHIRRQIALHPNLELAKDKWRSDDDFVANYNKGAYAEYDVMKVRR